MKECAKVQESLNYVLFRFLKSIADEAKMVRTSTNMYPGNLHAMVKVHSRMRINNMKECPTHTLRERLQVWLWCDIHLRHPLQDLNSFSEELHMKSENFYHPNAEQQCLQLTFGPGRD